MKTFTLARLKRYSIATAVYAVLLSLLVFVAACDEPSRQERFEAAAVRVGVPTGATNIQFIDGQWYTFEWKDQCFLAMQYWRHASVTKIDCEDE